MKNKYTIGIIILILSLFVNIVELKSQVVQSNFLLETKNNNLTKEEFAERYSLKTKYIKEFYPVKIDKQVLLNTSDPLINIKENILRLKKNKMIERSQNSFSYFGTIGNETSNRIIITVRNDFVAGTIFLNSKEYNIVTFKDMNQYLLRANDNFACGNSNKISENTSPIIDNITSKLKSVNVNSCNMRILVLYTPNAEALFSDILTSIQHVFDVANYYLRIVWLMKPGN